MTSRCKVTRPAERPAPSIGSSPPMTPVPRRRVLVSGRARSSANSAVSRAPMAALASRLAALSSVDGVIHGIGLAAPRRGGVFQQFGRARHAPRADAARRSLQRMGRRGRDAGLGAGNPV